MTNPPGTPIWFDLVTTDAAGARAFYADVVGWTAAAADPAASDGYHILSAPDGEGVGGLMTLPPGAPMRPGWLAYIGVDDVDAAVAHVRALGGHVAMGPHDIPGIGRFALAADPQGLPFYVMRGASPESSRAFAPGVPGHANWMELVSDDADAAIGFYGALLGWRNDESMGMGALGDYRFLDLGPVRLGALMAARGGWAPRWTVYFGVPSVAAAAARVAAAGGTVDHGPHAVPDGSWILLGTDPQGCAFALAGGE